MAAACVMQTGHAMCSGSRHAATTRRSATQEGRAHTAHSTYGWDRKAQGRQGGRVVNAGHQWQPKAPKEEPGNGNSASEVVSTAAPDVALANQQTVGDGAASREVSCQAERTPADAQDHELLVRGVIAALTSMASLAQGPEKMTRFHCKYPPSMSIGDYISRIRRFFGCDVPCYVLTLLYIDRLVRMHPEIVFSTLSSHRLIITAITLSAKFHEDIFYSNKHYAKVGGVPLPELNKLEHCFLEMIEWKLTVTPEEYQMYEDLARQAATPLPVTGSP